MGAEIAPMPAQPILKIAVPLPLYRLLDYLAPPDEPLASLQPGCRVEVRVANRRRIGIIWDIAQQSAIAPEKLRPVDRLLDNKPLFSDSDRRLLGWCASYYHHPLGEVVHIALPSRLRQGLEPATGRIAAWRLLDREIDLARFRRAPLQKQVVGRLLADLGRRAQVLCVTHLPQVAAQGQHHFVVSKSGSARKTTSRMNELEGEARVGELARMLGGLKITDNTLAHAREMLGAVP